MNRFQKITIAGSSALLCIAAASGCGALHDAPISNARANENPAARRSDADKEMLRKQEKPKVESAQEGADRKESEEALKKAKKNPAEAARDMQPVVSTSDLTWVTAVNWASTKLGHKYVWGGDSDEDGGFDCSGLMQASYAQAGIKLPRVANDQYETTDKHPAEKDLRMGDLVFFGDSPRGIHHVGMYVGRDEEGNAMMLHAPNSHSVIRFNKIHYMDDYYGATRVIP